MAVTTVRFVTLTMNAMSRNSTSESCAPFSSARFTASLQRCQVSVIELDVPCFQAFPGMTGECQAAEFLLQDGLEGRFTCAPGLRPLL